MNLNRCEIKKGILNIKSEHINIVSCSKATILFPVCKKLCQLQIAFTVSGDFELIAPKDISFEMGIIKGFKITTSPGNGPYDIQPRFVYLPEKKSWYCIAQGNLTFFD